ncbi:E3 ubiquitin-protein ligase ZSWIM2 [Megalops cyprinoides]|uniref:E3 ubiquitin-protein ligase ZSWIM2 n=1 Tax=Megalops cyprinoides TaxID=118141 RepID=UPI001864A287|nr:E3 ubiquitin-protein ligase ZSWIM2 [Megalops cyprinoides]
MFRKTLWRNTASDVVSRHQDQALSTTIFILKEYGPTGFLLKEEGESKSFKACLGNPHTCTCPTYVKERDLCKHICWVLIRKFRLPRDHEYCFQLGLADGQINEMVRGRHRPKTPRPADTPTPPAAEEDGGVRQKEVEEGDVCPICQEDLMAKRLPVSYCRYGCGNNVHISCMKIWADHQSRADADCMVKCPLCREVYAPMKVLLEQVKNAASLLTTAERERSDKHLGIPCNSCKVCPITGKCFRCTVCSHYHLCEDCFNKHGHAQHPLVFRLVSDLPVMQIVRHNHVVEFEGVPAQIVKGLLAVEVRQGSKLLSPGQQCRLCLKSFHPGQHVKHLPCHHKFHADCADTQLQQSNSCPLDGHIIYNPLTWKRAGSKSKPKEAPPTQGPPKLPDQLQQDLFVPGLGLQVKTTSGGPAPRTAGPQRSDPSIAPPLSDSAANGAQGLCGNDEHTETAIRERGSSDPGVQTNPPLRDARCVPPKECRSPEPLRGEPERARPSTNARRWGRNPAARRMVKSLDGAAVPAGAERPQQSLVGGLNGLEIPVHPRGTVNTSQTRLQKRPPAPRPSPAAARERDPAFTVTGVLTRSADRGRE